MNLNPPVVVGLWPLVPAGNFIAWVELTTNSPDVVNPSVLADGVAIVLFSISRNSKSTFCPLTVCLKFKLTK